jgi:hypothetical protein
MSEALRSIPTEQTEWITRVLGVKLAAPAAPQPAIGIVALQKSRLAWDTTRKSVLAQLKSIEAAIIADVTRHNEDPDTEDEYDLTEVTGSLPKLYQLLERYDERLIDKLDEALNAEGEERARLNKQAQDVVKEYQAFLGNDEELAQIDKNGFVASTVRPVIEKTLTVLAKML